MPRQADEYSYGALSEGEFCYVLTSEQMGKYSLMARAAMRLTGTTPPSAVSRVITVAPQEVPQQRDLDFLLTHHPL